MASFDSPLKVLTRKARSNMAGDLITATTPLAEANRSRFNSGSKTTIGTGYVDAVLSVLHGLLVSFSFDSAQKGRVVVRSSSGSGMYHVSWMEDSSVSMGGFPYEGKPTYHAAIIGLAQAVAMFQTGKHGQSSELLTRWFALVQTMERLYPRPRKDVGWDQRTLQLACHQTETRALIEQVCDSLHFSMFHYLPTMATRNVGVTELDVLNPGEGSTHSYDGQHLLNPVGLTSLVPLEGADPVGEDDDPGSLDDMLEGGAPATRAAADPAPDAPSPGKLFGPYIVRIRRALERLLASSEVCSLFLSGPTATGKTTQAISAVQELGYGIENCVFDEGMDEYELFGGYARLTGGTSRGGWTPVDGPITRWARRAIAGEKVALILDELPRGPRKVGASVMKILNRYDRRTVVAQGLSIPPGAERSLGFHIIDAWHTRERLVVPAERVAILATGNIGDGYMGQDLSDPAFRRRWSAWLHLGSYESATVAEILADRLELPARSRLNVALRDVMTQLDTYQKKEERLLSTIDLATLIAWGQAVLYLVNHEKRPVKEAFVEAAKDAWMERVCPLKGSDIDPDVYKKVLDLVTAAAPTVVK